MNIGRQCGSTEINNASALYAPTLKGYRIEFLRGSLRVHMAKAGMRRILHFCQASFIPNIGPFDPH